MFYQYQSMLWLFVILVVIVLAYYLGKARESPKIGEDTFIGKAIGYLSIALYVLAGIPFLLFLDARAKYLLSETFSENHALQIMEVLHEGLLNTAILVFLVLVLGLFVYFIKRLFMNKGDEESDL